MLLPKYIYICKYIHNCIKFSETYFSVFKMKAIFFNVHGSVHRKNILINIQQDATLHNLFFWKLHISGGTTTHHQERIQLYLQHLVFVTTLLLSAAIVEELEPVTLKPVPTLPR